LQTEQKLFSHPGSKTLSVQIDGAWEPADFIEVFTGIERLYYRLAPMIKELDDKPYKRSARWRRRGSGRFNIDLERDYRPPKERLAVSSVTYSSPGHVNFKGLGPAIDALGQLIQGLVALVTERVLRRERDKQAAVETERLEIQRDRERVSLTAEKITLVMETIDRMEGFGTSLPPETREEVIHELGGILRLAQEGLIVGASTSGKDGSSDLFG
jgi:hypothetical protein